MIELTFLRIAVALFLGAASLNAVAVQRTFVASYGLDTNPCSISSPCRTFAAAMAQTDANGEVVVLDSAGYGAFTISQSVSVIAPDGVYAGISVFPGQHGVVVNGAGAIVTLRGLVINGQGGDDGVRIVNAGDVFIEKITVANTGNDINDAGIRIVSGGTVGAVFVTDTTVRGTAGPGLWIEANATVQVDRSRIEGNGGTGIRGWAPSGRLTVSDSLVSGNQGTANSGVGVHVASLGPGTWEVTVTRSTVDGNANSGIVVGSGANGTYRVAVTDNMVRRNAGGGVGTFANPGETVTALVGNNRIMGNLTGISCGGGGTSALVAERNEVVGNLRAFDGAGGCTFESLGNNAARRNTEPDFGTITTVPLR